jgi:aminoglycoside/choline kinase family phosphotransferase
MLPEDSQRRLLAGYLRGAEPAWRVDELFWPAAAQRLSQALGAFGRLSARPETARFAARIPPALAMLRRALGFQNGLDALARLVDSLLA